MHTPPLLIDHWLRKNDAFILRGYVASNGKINLNDELERIWKEAIGPMSEFAGRD
jgi:hypothetical protein